MPPVKVGYIGLGHAGYPMAANLARSSDFTLQVHDADASRAEQFAKEFPKTSTVAGKGKDAFRDVDVLVTMVPDGGVVRDVLLGDEGVGRSLKKGM
jgi:3-hydroxyisobutyrate dehydrogenase